jgi:hypothetical protein
MESITDPKPNQVNDKRPFLYGFLFFAGVLLPAAAFGLELITRMCAQQFFDPMPTWWHTLFVFLSPRLIFKRGGRLAKNMSSARFGSVSLMRSPFLSRFFTPFCLRRFCRWRSSA